LLTRNNREVLQPVDIDCPYDFNRDRRVNATDVLLARNHQTGFADALKLIDLSGPEGGAEAVEAAVPLAGMARLAGLEETVEKGDRHRAGNTFAQLSRHPRLGASPHSPLSVRKSEPAAAAEVLPDALDWLCQWEADRAKHRSRGGESGRVVGPGKWVGGL